MFAKLKKKIADEAATAPRSGVRIPRTVSKESIASVGADSGDDFASDGSSSRDDLPAQILRRNDQIRKLEAKLSASIKKLQEQSEAHQANRTKMAEGMAFALEKKDEEWTEKMDAVEKEKAALSGRLEETMEQSLVLFQKRDDLDELEGFQQQELAKVKHMLLKKEELLSQRGRELRQKEAEVQSARRGLSETRGKLAALEELHEESCRINSELEIEREELLLLREEADKKVAELEGRCREMHSVIQQVSEDFQKSQSTVSSLEGIIQLSQTEQAAMKVQQQKAAVTLEDKERLITDLQKKVSSLERRLDGNLSQDEHLQELLQEKSSLEQSLEESRAELLTVRTNQADTVCSLEAQVFRMSCRISELQTLLRHKDESSRAYRERTDVQISNLEQQLLDDGERLKSAAQQITDKQQNHVKLQGEWSAEKVVLDQQVCLLEQQRQEEAQRLQENISSLQDRLADVDQQRNQADSVLMERTDELERCREELSRQQTENNEVSKVQEEIRQQKDKLQTQVRTLTASLQTSQQEVTSVTEKVTLREENTAALQNELHCVQVSLLHLQEEVEQQRTERVQLEQLERDKDSELMIMREELLAQTQQLDGCQARISYLEVEVETLTEQLQSPPVCEEDQNGSVTVDDVDDVQKVNRELEQQLSDKNMTIRQLQQRLAELKRTLQKELKLKPEPDPEGKDGSPESRADKQDKVSLDPQPASSPSPRPSRTTVTNTSDLNDSREINFEYLKHVVLKFMSSREAEAYQLIRAVSVLLNFSREEEELLKQTLDYKMSWFGSKPSPKGTIRPSVSGSSSNWS